MSKTVGLLVTAGVILLIGAPGAAFAASAPTSTIPVGQFPFHIVVSADGSEAYVGNQNDGTVSVIDVETQTVARTITGMANPLDLAVADDGTLYAAQRDSATVTVVPAGADSPSITLNIDDASPAIALAPGGNSLWVALADEVVAIDTVSGAVQQTFAGFQYPSDLVVNPAGDVFVASTAGNTVTTISGGIVTNSQVLTTMQNGLAVVGDTAWVSAGPQGGLGTLTQVNLTDGSIGWTVGVGDLPGAPAIDANGYLYVPSVYSGEVTVVSPTGAVVDQIDVGADSGPISAAIAGDNGFVVLSAADQVAVFDLQVEIGEETPTPTPTVAPTDPPTGTGTGSGTGTANGTGTAAGTGRQLAASGLSPLGTIATGAAGTVLIAAGALLRWRRNRIEEQRHP